MPLRTEKNGTDWPNVRAYTEVGDTIASGITASAYLDNQAKDLIVNISGGRLQRWDEAGGLKANH